MAVRVKYFASLRDQMGRAEDQLTVAEPLTVADVWSSLWPETPLPTHILIAVNQQYAPLTQPVTDGDEVAFFPPVTGG